MLSTTFIKALVAFAAIASAHMEMVFPPPLNSKSNPNSVAADIDYSMTSPLLQVLLSALEILSLTIYLFRANGKDFPCKGYQTQLGSPSGASVVTWSTGSEANMTIAGGAFHNGGQYKNSSINHPLSCVPYETVPLLHQVQRYAQIYNYWPV